MALLPYFPLAGGLLSGKFKRGAPMPPNTRMSQRRYSDRFVNDRNWRLTEELDAFARRRGRSLLELAFGWLLGQRGGGEHPGRRQHARAGRAERARRRHGSSRPRNWRRSTASPVAVG